MYASYFTGVFALRATSGTTQYSALKQTILCGVLIVCHLSTSNERATLNLLCGAGLATNSHGMKGGAKIAVGIVGMESLETAFSNSI